ncbi:MAG: glycosyltransferase [Actinobacteria bacterium]|nr:glycosyltransferase [Actinomycetota bacterium]
MRITITTAGSRGDVQPYVALGLGLREAGHEVRLATYAPFEGFVRGRGLGYYPITGDPGGAVAELLVAEYREACRDADAVVYSPVGFLGYHVAEKMDIPAIGAAVQPLFSRTRRFPSSLLGRPPGRLLEEGPHGSLYNRLTYLAAEQLFWQTMRPVVAEARAELGLDPLPFLGPFGDADQRRLPILYGWSPSVLSQPPEWGGQLCTTGYWFLDRPGWRPPDELVDFLDAGPPPVSVGFGSMNNVDPEEITTRVLEALRRSGQRGILLTGWSGIGRADLPDEVFKTAEVPHDWLFGRVRAAVHHGGAGTTAASLRAGLPTVVVPFFLDQAFWGWRVAKLGVGPEPVARKKLTSERLAAAILRAATDADVEKRARLLGEKIRAEDGVTRAVEAFHRIFAHV